MKKYEENLMESAKDMTDEEIYELSKGIVNNLYNQKPVLNNAGWTPEDVLNHQFAYFYDKQSRGLESPLTLKNKVTKAHLKNIIYNEFKLAIAYHIRSTKNQNLIDRNKTISLQEPSYISQNDGEIGTIESSISLLKSDIPDCISEIDNKLDEVKILNYISDKIDEHFAIRYNYKHDLVSCSKKNGDIDYKAVQNNKESTYKKFSLRELAKLYFFNDVGRQMRPSDLEGLIVEKDESGNYIDLDRKSIKKLMDQLKTEVSLNLFNNDLRGELEW